MSEPILDAELKQLLGAVAAGDEAAMAKFYDRTCDKVFGLAKYMLRDASLAEEVALDTFFQVWQEAGKYREEKARPLAWVLMMLRSRAIDRLRSLNKLPFPVEDISLWVDELTDPGEGPEEALASAERGRLVRACLAKLPLVERQKLTLAFFMGLSQTEMSAYCGMPLGTVKSHIRNGMAHLGQLLGRYADR